LFLFFWRRIKSVIVAFVVAIIDNIVVIVIVVVIDIVAIAGQYFAVGVFSGSQRMSAKK
jgi:hypothetical protein